MLCVLRRINVVSCLLKLLKRSGLSVDDPLCFYKSVIRSVLEYGSVVWRHHFTHAQSDKLEALQKRALRIIFSQFKSNQMTDL